MTETDLPLAAVRYDTGFRIDDFMAAAAKALAAAGVRLGGAIQTNSAEDCAYNAAMTLVDLRTGGEAGISQDLGVDATGCRLDPRGLVAMAADLDAAIGGELDLLLLNKFGRAEADGGGLRQTLTRALDAGVPVLTAVRAPYDEAWNAFHGGLAATLPPDLDAVVAWCRRTIAARAATPVA